MEIPRGGSVRGKIADIGGSKEDRTQRLLFGVESKIPTKNIKNLLLEFEGFIILTALI